MKTLFHSTIGGKKTHQVPFNECGLKHLCLQCKLIYFLGLIQLFFLINKKLKIKIKERG